MSNSFLFGIFFDYVLRTQAISGSSSKPLLILEAFSQQSPKQDPQHTHNCCSLLHAKLQAGGKHLPAAGLSLRPSSRLTVSMPRAAASQHDLATAVMWPSSYSVKMHPAEDAGTKQPLASLGTGGSAQRSDTEGSA